MTALPNRQPRSVFAATLVATAVAGFALGLLGAADIQPASAAPVPVTQANCPPSTDPRPIAQNSTAFARVDGIPGDATRSDVAGQITLTSIRGGLLGAGAQAPGGGPALCGAGGPPAFDPIVVEKRIDRASVPLFAKAASGGHITSARLTVFTPTGREFLAYDLTNVTVLAVRQVQRTDSLVEEVVFGFQRITWTFTPTNPDGTPGTPIKACWDRVRGTSC